MYLLRLDDIVRCAMSELGCSSAPQKLAWTMDGVHACPYVVVHHKSFSSLMFYSTVVHMIAVW